MVSEEECEEEWNEHDEWNETWNEGYQADDRDWNDGHWAAEELYYKDEDNYFQRKP